MPKQQGQINSINLYLTTLCNYKCVGCCAHTQDKGSMTVDEIRSLATKLGKVDTIILTGGEPTLHKNFRDILAEILKLDYNKLVIQTNGFGLMKYIDLWDNFDEIRISHYDKKSYPNAQENTHIIEEFKSTYKGRATILQEDIVMIPHNNGRRNPCFRGSWEVASIWKDKVYGCCVGGGMDTAEGAEVDENWRTTAKQVELPCGLCPFATL